MHEYMWHGMEIYVGSAKCPIASDTQGGIGLSLNRNNHFCTRHCDH